MDKVTLSSVSPYKIGFLLIDDLAIMSYSSTTEPLRAANLLAGKSLYSIVNIPAYGSRAVSSSGVEIRANAQLGEQSDFDLVLVIAGGDPTRFQDKRIFQWLRHLARREIPLGGISGGPVILAAAGVMQGRRMTVHWEHADIMAEMYPELLLERTLYVMDRDRCTCAGGTAPLDMMSALIASHHGIDFARQVCDWFMHTEVRTTFEPQRSGLAERYHVHNGAVLDAINLMQDHLADPLDLKQLAALTGISVRQLNRLFHDHLGRSTMTFYKDLRLESARLFLEKSPLKITEIALATGFASSAAFSKAFRERYQQPPSHFRQR